MGLVTDVIFLSVFAPQACAVEIFVDYMQPCLRVVSWWSVDIPLVLWGLCFEKVGGVISCLVGPVWWYRWTGPQCPPIHPCLSLQYLCCNSLCASGLVSVCYIWFNYLVLSGVLCDFRYAPSTSLSPSPGPEP